MPQTGQNWWRMRSLLKRYCVVAPSPLAIVTLARGVNAITQPSRWQREQLQIDRLVEIKRRLELDRLALAGAAIGLLGHGFAPDRRALRQVRGGRRLDKDPPWLVRAASFRT